jgi:hypothetical protein
MLPQDYPKRIVQNNKVYNYELLVPWGKYPVRDTYKE